MTAISFIQGHLLAVVLLSGVLTAYSQSTDQNFPTPVTSNEIVGTIKARDIGDSRQTRYFYTFDGVQGDIFINVVTKNFSGDIDIFTADSLKPMTKMVIFPDSAPAETGRLVYLRKSERLILRIEGRTPNDEAATFRIKFGGSFIAIQGQKESAAPVIKNPDGRSDAGIRVNSVGTIIEAAPRGETAKAPVETTNSRPDTEKAAEKAKKQDGTAAAKPATANSEKPVVIVSPMPDVATIFGNKKPTSNTGKPKNTEAKPAPPTKIKQGTKAAAPSTVPPKPDGSEKKPDPLASIRLVVLMKTGETIEKPLSDVLRFSVDKGVLTVIGKDGKVARYSILDVAKVTIE